MLFIILGGPWFSEWQDVEFAKEWLKERDEYLSQNLINYLFK